jgi:hypothetical protein
VTLRELMEQQKAAHPKDPDWEECFECAQGWPCPDYKRAEAALAIIAESQLLEDLDRVDVGYGERFRLVPDPPVSS